MIKDLNVNNIVNLLTVLVGVYLAWQAKRIKDATAKAALEQEAARRLATEQKIVLDQVHELGNSRMGAELLTGLAAARTAYAGSPTEANKMLLEVAEKKFTEHNLRQARADQVRIAGQLQKEKESR